MFYSEPPFADLIFQDATQKIIVLEPGKKNIFFPPLLNREVVFLIFFERKLFISKEGLHN